jgi:hypothetical protein
MREEEEGWSWLKDDGRGRANYTYLRWSGLAVANLDGRDGATHSLHGVQCTSGEVRQGREVRVSGG